MIRRVTKSATRPRRLAKEKWLELALECLANQGPAKLTIDRLVGALGVTKGSFYWHFRDRSDFQIQLLKYWDQHFTRSVIEQIEPGHTPPADKLWSVMEIVCNKDLTRYDIAIRAWAAQDKAIANLVGKVDESRLGYVRSLFQQLGFRGPELEMRTRSFVTYVSLEMSLSIHQTKRQRLNCLKRFHQLMTRK